MSVRECDGSNGTVGLRRERQALRDLVRLATPLVAGALFDIIADRFTLVFVGHWDFQNRAHYDGAGLGKMYSNITGLSLGLGANIGLATFCSQAHGAGRSVQMNAVFVRRSWTMLVGIYCFSLVMASVCEPLLMLLGQPADVARCSARFAQVHLIGVPFYWGAGSMNLALNSTKRTRPGLVMRIVSSIAQVGLSAMFACPSLFDFGYIGVALGRSVGGIISLLTMVLYIKYHRLEAWVWRLHPDAEKVFRPGALPSYLAVSIPSALIIWSEWWAFEVLSIFVGLTPDATVNLAAHGTMFNIIVIFYMGWTSTSNACCALVGNLLGAERNADIPPLLRATFFFSGCTSLVVALGYELFKGQFASLFTEDQMVRDRLCSSSMGLVLSVPLYAQMMSFYGVLRAANRQRPGIIGTFVGYWLIGLPFGGLLGCVWHWPTPLVGVWFGNVLALLIGASWVCGAVFYSIDWLSVTRLPDANAALLSDPPSRELVRGGHTREAQNDGVTACVGEKDSSGS